MPEEHGTYQGVSVDHPSIVAACQNIAKSGGTKEEAQRITGMPMEVVDKHFKRALAKD
jgi:hypothetical protein